MKTHAQLKNERAMTYYTEISDGAEFEGRIITSQTPQLKSVGNNI